MKRLFFALAAFVLLGSSSSLAEELANVEYLCADWGPAMKLPAKKGDQPEFSDTEEEIYFLKQVTSIKRTKLRIPDPIAGSTTKDELAGRGIYLCKMKPDGSGKTEIKELWRNPNYPIDTQAQSTWMDVNDKTRTIALSVVLGGSDVTGMWTMKSDGSNLKRIMTPDMVDGHLRSYGSPSWTPDGQWLVFSEAWRGTNYCRIAKCDKQGGQRVYLTNGPVDGHPRVSPDGKQIAYIHWFKAATWLYLMGIDGADQHPVPNPVNKKWGTHGGTYPAWSPEGGRIFAVSAGIVDVASGRVVNDRRPLLDGKPWAAEYAHWGKLGLLGSANGFRITLTDSEMQAVKLLAVSTQEQVAANSSKPMREGH